MTLKKVLIYTTLEKVAHATPEVFGVAMANGRLEVVPFSIVGAKPSAIFVEKVGTYKAIVAVATPIERFKLLKNIHFSCLFTMESIQLDPHNHIVTLMRIRRCPHDIEQMIIRLKYSINIPRLFLHRMIFIAAHSIYRSKMN